MSKTLLLILSLVMSCSMIGCGGGGGSTANLNTVSLSVSPASNRLEADVSTGNTCSATGVSSGGTLSTDTISVDVTSTAYPNTLKPSPVTIQRIIISYAPAISGVPAIPVYYDTGFVIPPNTTATAQVHVTDKLKLDLLNSFGFQLCSSNYFEYNVTITFEGVEDFTNKSVSFSTQVKVAFADRV